MINYKFAEKILQEAKQNRLEKTIDLHLMNNVYPHNKYYISLIPAVKQNKRLKQILFLTMK